MAIPNNWPALWIAADLTQGPPNTPGASALSLQYGTVQTTAVQTKRGRQYELGHAEAGTATLTVNDPSELLNPINTSSIYNSGSSTLLPYRCDQVGAFWNTSTNNTAGNLLTTTNRPPGGSANYDPSFETQVNWMGNFGSASTLVQSTVQHFDGTHSCACTFTSLSDVVGAGLRLPPGQTVTLSCYVFVPAGYTVTLTVGQFSPTVTVYGTATSSTTGSWQRLSVTAVITQAIQYFTVRPASGTPYPFTMYLDAVQAEFGSSASTFSTSGPTFFPIHTGYVERYPQTWVDQGFRGIKPLDSVDALSVLSRTPVTQSYAATILADSPYAYAPLSDKAAPWVVQLPQGGQPYFGGTLLGNSSSAANFGGDTFLDGTAALSVVQQNSNPVTSGNPAYITYAIARGGLLTMNPQAFTIECWVKVTSGTVYLGAASLGSSETPGSEPAGPNDYAGWYTAAGALQLHYVDPNGGTGTGYAIGNGGTYGGYPDETWHHLVLIFPGGNNVKSIVDGVVGGTAPLASTPSTAVALNALFIDATTYFQDAVTEIAVANMALYPTALTNTQAQNHYQRGIGHLGENSMTRAGRLLAQYWGTNTAQFTYYTVGTGVATLDVDYDYDPAGGTARTVLDILQEITDAENSLVYVNGSGVVVVDGRETRLTASLTSAYTFGDGPGELPYLDPRFDYDPTYVYSEAQLTNKSGASADVINATSKTAYGQRILNTTLAVADQWQLQQAAIFYTTRYAKPAGAPGTGTGLRIESITISPGTNPALFSAALSLEIGSRITVKRRPNGVVMSGDYYVESISHDIAWDGDSTHWTVTMELSPFWHSPWILGDATYGVLGSTTIVTY